MRVVAPSDAAALVGTDLGASAWITVDQATIDAFAGVTGDHQFIHVDPARAATTPFGGTIAHGFLTLSLLASMIPDGAIVLEGVTMGVNYGFERVRFLAPVPSGSRIRARHALGAIQNKGGGRWLVTTEVTVEVEGSDKPALVATWLGMQYC